MNFAALDSHLEPDFKRLIDNAVTVHISRRGVNAVRHLADVGPHLLFRTALQFGNGCANRVLAVPLKERSEPLLSDGERTHLRPDVPDPLFRNSNVAQD